MLKFLLLAIFWIVVGYFAICALGYLLWLIGGIILPIIMFFCKSKELKEMYDNLYNSSFWRFPW